MIFLVARCVSIPSLIYPVFVLEQCSGNEPIPSMPDIERQTLDNLLHQAEQACELGIPMLTLFPASVPHKDLTASEAYNPEASYRTPCAPCATALPSWA